MNECTTAAQLGGTPPPEASAISAAPSSGKKRDAFCPYDNCGRPLAIYNHSGFCKIHHGKSPSQRQRMAEYYQRNRIAILHRAHIRKGFKSQYWDAGTCRIEDCDEILRSDNSSGLCKHHRKLEWQRRAYNPARASESRHRRQHGITLAEKREMLFLQRGCGICAAPPTEDLSQWETDHDHVTGNIRGILCTRCNTGLGLLRDDPAVLLAAVAYLDRAKP